MSLTRNPPRSSAASAVSLEPARIAQERPRGWWSTRSVVPTRKARSPCGYRLRVRSSSTNRYTLRPWRTKAQCEAGAPLSEQEYDKCPILLKTWDILGHLRNIPSNHGLRQAICRKIGRWWDMGHVGHVGHRALTHGREGFVRGDEIVPDAGCYCLGFCSR